MTVRWPHGNRAACAFTFDLDAESLWLARGVNEPVTLSQGTFGVLEALPRILDLLRETEIAASFFVPAWVAEHHPDAVKTIATAGHEVGCHGDVHEKVSDLDAEQEEKILLRSVEVLTRQAGRRPGGYRAPAWQFSPRTLGLLAKHGRRSPDGAAARQPARPHGLLRRCALAGRADRGVRVARLRLPGHHRSRRPRELGGAGLPAGAGAPRAHAAAVPGDRAELRRLLAARRQGDGRRRHAVGAEPPRPLQAQRAAAGGADP